MLGFGLRPDLERGAAVHASGERLEQLLRGVQLPGGDRQQTFDRHREAFVELYLLFESIAPEPERGAGPRRDVVLEIFDIGADGLRRLGLRVGEIAQEVQIVNVGEGARQIVVDELEGALHRLDADLDEDARRLLDVVARRLDDTRRLPQLRQDAPGALRGGRMGEERLTGQAHRQDVGVELGIASPRCGRSRARTSGSEMCAPTIRCSSRSVGVKPARSISSRRRRYPERACASRVDAVATEIF